MLKTRKPLLKTTELAGRIKGCGRTQLFPVFSHPNSQTNEIRLLIDQVKSAQSQEKNLLTHVTETSWVFINSLIRNLSLFLSPTLFLFLLIEKKKKSLFKLHISLSKTTPHGLRVTCLPQYKSPSLGELSDCFAKLTLEVGNVRNWLGSPTWEHGIVRCFLKSRKPRSWVGFHSYVRIGCALQGLHPEPELNLLRIFSSTPVM